MAAGKKTGGRKPGSINKATFEFRTTVQLILEKNSRNIGKWLDSVAESDPARALDVITRLAEFAAPKLARTEITGKDGGAIETKSMSDLELGRRFLFDLELAERNSSTTQETVQ